MGWIFRTDHTRNGQIEGIRSSRQADAYNRKQSRIGEKSAGQILADACRWKGNVLYQGSFPVMPAHQSRDLRPELLHQIVTNACSGAPAILIYSDEEAAIRSIFSQCTDCMDVRIRGDHLLDGLPVETLLTSFMGSPDDMRTELRMYLEQVIEYQAAHGGAVTPEAVAELLCRPGPMLQEAPAPRQDGSFDFMAVGANQREQMARMLRMLCEEWPDQEMECGGSATGLSFYGAVRSGKAVSCYCSWNMPQTWKILSGTLQRLDREQVPFSLIFDQPPVWKLPSLLAAVNRHPVFLRVDQTPGLCTAGGEDASRVFQNTVSHFDICILSQVGDGAELWSEHLGKYDRVLQSNNSTKGLFFDMRMLPGFRRDRSRTYSVAPDFRLQPNELRGLCGDTGKLVVCQRGEAVIYR